jgi:hypothetical protein
VNGDGQPSPRDLSVGDWGEVAAVLVVAAGELDVVEDDPDVDGVDLANGSGFLR